MEKISIIVPVYKTEKYLRRCIESILVQTYTNFELIIVNDGSPDNSQAIIDELVKKDSRIKSIYKENSGPSAARNVGIEASTGEYILFCDSDDTVQPNWIMELYKAKQKHKMSLIISGIYQVNETGKLLCIQNMPQGIYTKDRYYELIAPGLSGGTYNKIYDRNIIVDEQIRFDENITYGEDVKFNLEYMNYMKDIVVIEPITYYYYKYSNIETLSSNATFEKKIDVFKMRLPYISEQYMEVFEKSFLYSCWEDAKIQWLTSDNKDSLYRIVRNETFQCLLKKYGRELFDNLSLWALQHQSISLYMIIQKLSKLKNLR